MKITNYKNTETMKKSLFLASAMALLSIAACNKEDIKQEVPDRSERIYTFAASVDTKATLGDKSVEWTAEDKIGTFAKGKQNGIGRINIGTPCTFQVTVVGALAVGDKVYAYAPYSENAGTSATEVAFTIPAAQTREQLSMPLVAQPFEVTEKIEEGTETAVAGMNFYNLASVAVLKIFSDGKIAAGEKIQSVSLTSTADICGSYTLDISAVDASNEATLALAKKGGEKTVTVSIATPVDVVAAEADALSVPVVLAPGTYPLAVSVVTDKATYTLESSEDLEFVRSHRKSVLFNIADTKPAGIEITPSDLRSFGRGATLEYEVELTKITENVTVTAPEGWTAVLEGTKLKVTASTDDSKALSGKVTLSAGEFSKEVEVRRAGLNNQEELVAFTKSVGNMNDDKFVGDIDAKYLDNGEISVNADIEIPTSSMFESNAYWLRRLRVPLNGNGHKLTINTTHSTKGGLIQNLGADVHDLVIGGTITANGANAQIGSLAFRLAATGLTISNVKSTVDIVVSNNGCRAGGIIGVGDYTFSVPETLTLENCSFDGSITVNANAYAVGGIFAAVNGVAMKTLNMNGCQFNGSISINGDATAVGGLFGHAEAKGVHATFTGCKVSNTAKITCKDGVAQYVGGFIGSGGACGNPGEIMTMKDCTFEGTIDHSINKNITNQCYVRIGGFLGNLERGAEFSNCKFLGVITANWNGHNALIDAGTGLGGFVGRTAGYNSSAALNMKADFTECVSKGTITILNSVESENANKARVGHLIGISNYGDAFVKTDCTFESEITLNGKALTIEGK